LQSGIPEQFGYFGDYLIRKNQLVAAFNSSSNRFRACAELRPCARISALVSRTILNE
jgi:hypothetical protein